jgi:two-component system NtrC family response regulator
MRGEGKAGGAARAASEGRGSHDARRRKLLVLANDRTLRRELEATFADLEVLASEASAQAPALARRFKPDVVLLDLGPAAEPAAAVKSLELLRQVVGVAPGAKVIALTEKDARAIAVDAIGLGAADFHHKPVDRGVLSLVVRRAFRLRELEEENWRLREQTGSMALEGVIGVSEAMRTVCRAVEKVAPTHATVLLLGESGTGKELLARALHRLSDRSHGPFVAIDCAAKRAERKLELAEGGTVFLDDVSETPPAMQAKLLRLVQERSIERIGGRTPARLDVRLVCATNRDLDGQVAAGAFRDDLYYRIGEVSIRVPALRDRQGDSVLLAQSLLRQAVERYGRNLRSFTPDAIRAIQTHRWPGNVRELENRIKSAVIVTEGVVVTAGDLGLHDPGDDIEHLSLRAARQRADAQAVRQALAVAGGNLSRAAELLGVTRPTLYDLLDRHRIDASQFARSATTVGAHGTASGASSP